MILWIYSKVILNEPDSRGPFLAAPECRDAGARGGNVFLADHGLVLTYLEALPSIAVLTLTGSSGPWNNGTAFALAAVFCA